MKIIQTAVAQTASSWEALKLKPFSTSLATGSWQQIVTTISGWIFLFAAIIAFFYLIYSGFIYLTAGGNPDSAKKGQQGLLNAIIGLVIIFLAYGIVRAMVSFLNTAR